MESIKNSTSTWDGIKQKLESRIKSGIDDLSQDTTEYQHISINKKRIIDMSGIDGGKITYISAAHFSK